jgi:GDPmannose 4,6-dehydratase
MFNTESPRRGDNFVTKKIVNYINKYREACLSNTWEKVPSLELGNLDAKRDWSHVKDSVEAIYRICNQRDYFTITWGHEIDLNIKFDKFSHEGIDRKVITAGTQEKPATAKEIADLQEQLSRPMKYKDYTFGSGKAYSVREFLKSALEFAFHSKNRFEFVDSGLQERVVDLHTGREIVVISPKFFRPAEVDYLLADSTVIKQELGWEPKISFDDLVADMFLGK